MSTSTDEDISALLARLQTKQTVQSVLVLDRTSGTIIQSSGSITTRNNEGLVNEYAGMVWKFVKAAEELVNGMNEEDGLKLLRLRTKLHELCIVPGNTARSQHLKKTLDIDSHNNLQHEKTTQQDL